MRFTDVAQEKRHCRWNNIVVAVFSLKLDGTANGSPDTAGEIYRVGYRGGKRYIRRVVRSMKQFRSNGTTLGAFVIKRFGKASW